MSLSLIGEELLMEIIKLSKIKIMDTLIINFLNQTLDQSHKCCLDIKN